MAFTCYSCGRKRPKSELGKTIDGKKVCKFCVPYVDEQDIGSMVQFDSSMKAPKKKPPGSASRKNK